MYILSRGITHSAKNKNACFLAIIALQYTGTFCFIVLIYYKRSLFNFFFYFLCDNHLLQSSYGVNRVYIIPIEHDVHVITNNCSLSVGVFYDMLVP